MPERFEIYIVYKRRYINTLPFLSYPIYVQYGKKIFEIAVTCSAAMITKKRAGAIKMSFRLRGRRRRTWQVYMGRHLNDVIVISREKKRQQKATAGKADNANDGRKENVVSTRPSTILCTNHLAAASSAAAAGDVPCQRAVSRLTSPRCLGGILLMRRIHVKQEALLPQRCRATRYVSEFVSSFTRYGC